MTLYRNFSTQEEIDSEYLIVDRIPDFDGEMRWYERESKATLDLLEHQLHVPYGPTLDEYVNIFPATAPDSPIVIFIHGGYWRRSNTEEFSFVARGLNSIGMATLVPNYSLCPKVSIQEITRQNRALVAWAFRNASRFSGDGNRIFLVGHSAGGQQAAMLASTDWAIEYGLPTDIIKGVIPISGIFDLGPLPYSFLQPALQLTQNEVNNQSPLFNIPKHPSVPMLITLGALESAEFQRQSLDYHNAWQRAGHSSQYWSIDTENHFSIIRGLGDARSAFLEKVATFIDGINDS